MDEAWKMRFALVVVRLTGLLSVNCLPEMLSTVVPGATPVPLTEAPTATALVTLVKVAPESVTLVLALEMEANDLTYMNLGVLMVMPAVKLPDVTFLTAIWLLARGWLPLTTKKSDETVLQ
jgi:hypothetical protein